MNNLEKYILEILLIKLDLLTNLTLKGCEVSSYIKSLINLDKSLKNNPEKFINLYQDDIIQETNRIKYYFDEEFTNKPHKNPLTFKLELIHHITDILIYNSDFILKNYYQKTKFNTKTIKILKKELKSL